ncbi:MAG: 50S ribosomal protein L6 [Clostridia bacterium]|jgi:large subunit ribosomal protein L6|nr:50S ribosomal protein L6 [Clostridia bacterium]MDD4570980.1 50S ribosomal protein L6 [Clostridia bacterium]
MSRIGKQPVQIPADVTVAIDGAHVEVKGPKGTLSRKFHPAITIKQEGGKIIVARLDDEAESRALHGLTRALLANMVNGVSTGFEKRLELVGVGYRAAAAGQTLTLNVGYSQPVEMTMPEGIKAETPAPTKIVLNGIDKELLGVVAANVRAVRPPEPYKGKGIRYQDEYVQKKAGKAGVKK